MNESELRNLMYTAQQDNMGPFSIRYPRGNGVMVDWRTPLELIEVGTGRCITEGEDVAVLSIGHPGNFVQKALKELEKENIKPAHYDIRFVKPLDEKLLHAIFQKFKKIITVEDGCVTGGVGSAVLEFMADNDYNAQLRRLGIPDRLVEHGEQIELHTECGYHPEGIVSTALEMLGAGKKAMAG
jgi:1-deoxy-D-xylulose-5-phosphate synthase